MRIEGIDECAVIVRLSPGDALLLADACRTAGYNSQTEEEHPQKQLFDLACGHLEALALIANAQGFVVENRAFLADFTLAHVREHWGLVGTTEKEASA